MRIRVARDRFRHTGEAVRADEFGQTLRRAKSGEAAAVTTLYRLLQPRLIRYLRVVVPPDAERIAAEAWVDVVRRLPEFDGDERGLYALGFSTARERAAAPARRDAGSLEPDTDTEHPGADRVDDDGMAGFGLRSALAAIARLPRDEAEVILLRVLGEMSVDEVAVLLDRPAESVGRLQVQALETLNWLMSPAGRPA
jgi:RNA polymerase sigma-70 factor (ECF subfamily)